MKRKDKILAIFMTLFMVSTFAAAIIVDIKMKQETKTKPSKYSFSPGEKKDWNSQDIPQGKRLWMERMYLNEEK